MDRRFFATLKRRRTIKQPIRQLQSYNVENESKSMSSSAALISQENHADEDSRIDPALVWQFGEILREITVGHERNIFKALVKIYGRAGAVLTNKTFFQQEYNKPLVRGDKGYEGREPRKLANTVARIQKGRRLPYCVEVELAPEVVNGKRTNGHIFFLKANRNTHFRLPHSVTGDHVPLEPFSVSSECFSFSDEIVHRYSPDHPLDVTIFPSGSWRPPASLENYYEKLLLRKGRNPKIKAKSNDDGNQHNSNFWHVAGIVSLATAPLEAAAVAIDVMSVKHSDYLATNVSLDYGAGESDEPTVRTLLNRKWNPSPGVYFPPAANPLAVTMCIIIPMPGGVDKVVLVTKLERDDSVAMQFGRVWLECPHGFVEAVLDANRSIPSVPDPRETAFRKTYEMTGIAIKHESVQWIGFMQHEKSGYATLIGTVRSTLPISKINELFNTRPKSENGSEIRTISITSQSIAKELEVTDAKPSTKVALGMLLARYGHASIGKTPTQKT